MTKVVFLLGLLLLLLFFRGRGRRSAFVLDQVFGASDDLHADDFVVDFHVSQQLLVIDDVTKDGVSSVQNVRTRRRQLGFSQQEEELRARGVVVGFSSGHG